MAGDSLSFASALNRLSILRPLRERNFRLLWLGQSVSILGDQFHLVALPLLVLHLTGSSLALGTVLVASTVPRVALYLVGGAITDLISPHKLLLSATLVRTICSGFLAAMVMLDILCLWHLFVLGAVFGTMDAFFSPAIKTFIPSLVSEEQLTAGNALLQGSSQLHRFMGPSLAGLVIASIGMGPAFGIDAMSFVFVGLCLLLMTPPRPGTNAIEPDSSTAEKPPAKTRFWLLHSIREGLTYALREPSIRSFMIIIGMVEFSFAGPFTVGLAILSQREFGGGATTYGVMLSALAGGLLLGTLTAGVIKSLTRIGSRLMLIIATLGTGLVLLGTAPNVIWASVLLFLMGTAGGYSQILTVVWLQTKVDPQMRGRVFSVVLFFVYGLTPLSYVITGFMTQFGTASMFITTGTCVLLGLLICFLSRNIQRLDET
ncbi:MAG TPA: MFS transporter [Pyrinomonadaceae bacterium]|jgi:MFS family permease